MNNIKSIALTIAALLIPALPLSAAETATKDFVAQGKVISSSCEISASQGISLPDLDVGTLGISQVSNMPVSTSSDPVVFNLTNCTPGSISISIVGTPDKNDPTSLAIDDTVENSAKNIALTFWADNKRIKLNEDSFKPLVMGNDYKAIFQVAAVKDHFSTTPEAGAISATAQIKVNFL